MKKPPRRRPAVKPPPQPDPSLRPFTPCLAWWQMPYTDQAMRVAVCKRGRFGEYQILELETGHVLFAYAGHLAKCNPHNDYLIRKGPDGRKYLNHLES